MGEMSTWCPSGVQVINSVVMEGVRVGDGAHIQGSILCAGVTMEPHASLRDCQVPPPPPLPLPPPPFILPCACLRALLVKARMPAAPVAASLVCLDRCFRPQELPVLHGAVYASRPRLSGHCCIIMLQQLHMHT